MATTDTSTRAHVLSAKALGVLAVVGSGVAAQGLMVFAQKSIQIGTIGIAQVAQPALALVWSFLILGEVVNGRQIAGIAEAGASVGSDSALATTSGVPTCA